MSNLTEGSIVPPLFTDGFFRDPYPTYAWLRKHAPVHWVSGPDVWLVSRYDDVRQVLNDHEHFSSENIPPVMQRLPPEVRARCSFLEQYRSSWMINRDEPDHSRLRQLVRRLFTPRAVRAWTDEIQSTANHLIDDLAAGYPTVDAVERYAYPLPALVVARILGIPEQDIDQFKDWTRDQALIIGSPTPTPELADRGHAATVAQHAYLADLAAGVDPGDPSVLATVVAAAREDRVSEAEALSMIGLLVFAGHETTTNLIANGLLALTCNPAQAEVFRSHTVQWSSMVDELLRFDSPVPAPLRTTRKDCEIAGEHIRAGQRVFPLLGSAHRDPNAFPTPDFLDLTRDTRRVIGFGHGIHFCLGASLARLEASIALHTLLDRFPNILRADNAPLEYVPITQFRALRALPVALNPDLAR